MDGEEAGSGVLTDEVASDVAFDELYARSWSRVVRLAALLTQDGSVAEELAQEAFAKVLARWSDVREPGAYVYRCVVNASAMYHRHEGVVRAKLPLIREDVVVEHGFGGLADAVAELPFRQRAVLVLRYQGGLGEHEIADVLGCRPGTVKSLASRALSALHKELS